ncbi:hypothetical protein D3C72_1329260 [compost metagenome]
MRRESRAQLLHKAVGEVRFEQGHFAKHGVGAAFHRKEERHFVGAELVDHQEGVFAVALGDIVNIAMHVLTRDRQICELAQNMTTDLGQHLRLVGADIKDLLIFLRREGVQTYGKHRQFARAAGRFKQTIRIGVVARRGIGFNVAHAFDVIVIVGVTAIVLHVSVVHALVVELAQDLLRRDTQVDPQMIHQL